MYQRGKIFSGRLIEAALDQLSQHFPRTRVQAIPMKHRRPLTVINRSPIRWNRIRSQQRALQGYPAHG
jgi:hypothetical protein